MSYEVTATRRRPQHFDDLVGQEFVAETLKNAIKSGKIAHAYLFSGPRGCGKTSSARILAKALNCKEGPTDSPCGKCSNCQEITKGSSLDVIEIDGASNTSVENIRQIKDEVLFPPTNSKYKIYIIDEVHMLSTSAFNALLKTIEEPPEYVIFIFATTELQKVPATIKSRCQQFNFRLVAIDKVKDCLKEASDELGIQADDEALYWIARESTGSMRDAYTLFDQVVAFSDGHITYDKIKDKLGLVGIDRLNSIFEQCVSNNTDKVMELLDEFLQRGVSIDQLISNSADYLRSILLIKNNIKKESLLGNNINRFSSLVLEKWTTIQTERALSIFLNLYRDIRYSLSPRYEIELAFSRLCWISEYISPLEVKKVLNSAIPILSRGLSTSNTSVNNYNNNQYYNNNNLDSYNNVDNLDAENNSNKTLPKDFPGFKILDTPNEKNDFFENKKEESIDKNNKPQTLPKDFPKFNIFESNLNKDSSKNNDVNNLSSTTVAQNNVSSPVESSPKSPLSNTKPIESHNMSSSLSFDKGLDAAFETYPNGEKVSLPTVNNNTNHNTSFQASSKPKTNEYKVNKETNNSNPPIIDPRIKIDIGNEENNEKKNETVPFTSIADKAFDNNLNSSSTPSSPKIDDGWSNMDAPPDDIDYSDEDFPNEDETYNEEYPEKPFNAENKIFNENKLDDMSNSPNNNSVQGTKTVTLKNGVEIPTSELKEGIIRSLKDTDTFTASTLSKTGEWIATSSKIETSVASKYDMELIGNKISIINGFIQKFCGKSLNFCVSLSKVEESKELDFNKLPSQVNLLLSTFKGTLIAGKI